MTGSKPSYSEPTTLWRFSRLDGSTARATIVPSGFGCTLVWWVNERVEGAEEFGDWEAALHRSDQVRAGLGGGGRQLDRP